MKYFQEDLVIATTETRIIARPIPVFMENLFAHLNGLYRILKNMDARNHVVFASREMQTTWNIFILENYIYLTLNLSNLKNYIIQDWINTHCMISHNLVYTKHVRCMPNVLFGKFPICYHPCRLMKHSIAYTTFYSLPWTKDRVGLHKPIRNHFCSTLTRFCYHRILLCLKGLMKECKKLYEIESMYQTFK